MKIEFTVLGVAAPQGSMYARYSEKLKRAWVVPDNKKTGPWRQAVAASALKAREASPGDWPMSGPVDMDVVFHLPRPTGHYGSNGLKPSAPAFPAVKPDLSKLVRAAEDAINDLVFEDDARVVHHNVWKLYSDRAEPPRAVFHLRELPRTVADLQAAGQGVIDDPRR